MSKHRPIDLTRHDLDLLKRACSIAEAKYLSGNSKFAWAKAKKYFDVFKKLQAAKSAAFPSKPRDAARKTPAATERQEPR